MHIRPHLQNEKAPVDISATDAFFDCTVFLLINDTQESDEKIRL